ncbi:MAG: ATP synthase subunit I [Bacillota bacterium]
MRDIQLIRATTLKADGAVLFASLAISFILGRADLGLSFAFGMVLGIANFLLHVLSVQYTVLGADPNSPGAPKQAVMKAAVAYFMRFAIVVAGLTLGAFRADIHLLPAVSGLLVTYVLLISVGIIHRGRIGTGDSKSE